MTNKLGVVIVTLCLVLLNLSFAQSNPINLWLVVADNQGRPSEPHALEFVKQVKTLSEKRRGMLSPRPSLNYLVDIS